MERSFKVFLFFVAFVSFFAGSVLGADADEVSLLTQGVACQTTSYLDRYDHYLITSLDLPLPKSDLSRYTCPGTECKFDPDTDTIACASDEVITAESGTITVTRR